MLKTFCDRCLQEFFKGNTIYGQIVNSDRTYLWELCEKCALELKDWVENKE